MGFHCCSGVDWLACQVIVTGTENNDYSVCQKFVQPARQDFLEISQYVIPRDKTTAAVPRINGGVIFSKSKIITLREIAINAVATTNLTGMTSVFRYIDIFINISIAINTARNAPNVARISFILKKQKWWGGNALI
jgi:hypothetical protein